MKNFLENAVSFFSLLFGKNDLGETLNKFGEDLDYVMNRKIDSFLSNEEKIYFINSLPKERRVYHIKTFFEEKIFSYN